MSFVPLMLVPLIVYNAIAFAFSDFSWDAPVLSLPMISGATWQMTGGDLFVAFAVIVLFIEMLKATRTGSGAIIDHILSTLVLIVCIVEFLVVPRAATSTFFLLLLVVLVDVIAGFSITIRSARRDFSVGPGPGVDA